MFGDPATVRVLSRVSAVVSFLGGLAIIGVMTLLLMMFSRRSFVAEFATMIRDPVFLLFVLSGVVAMALAPFIWRQKFWAMAAALALSGTFLFLFGSETELLRWSLTGTTVLFAVCGVMHWLACPAAR